MNKQLSGIRNQGYFVFHDAYGYFEEHYRLRNLGAFTLNPERRPGAKHLQNIRAELESSNAKCVFTEPQFKPAIVSSITDGLDITSAELDPVATTINPTPEGYFLFLQQIANAYRSCLSVE